MIKKLLSPIVLSLSFLFTAYMPLDFRTNQKKYSRVREAYSTKETLVKSWLTKEGMDFSDLKLYLRAFKAEQKLEIWASKKDIESFKLIKTYDFCQFSGTLGPKRQQGDLQTPEGIYHIDRFNPVSSFHLSMGINYPNKADKKLGQTKPGGDIFIHGNCVTVGCIPITDDKIKELYLLCVEAKNGGQSKITTHFYPYKMTESNHSSYLKKHPEHKKLWNELKPIYDSFEKTKFVPYVKINEHGTYVL